MQKRFDPLAGLLFPFDRSAQCPDMLAGMKKIQNLHCLFPSVLFQIPNPSRPIGQQFQILGPPQSGPQGLPMQLLAQFHRVSQSADHHLLGQLTTPVFFHTSLLDLIVNAHLHFVPFHPVVLGLFASPAWAPMPYQPAVQQQHS